MLLALDVVSKVLVAAKLGDHPPVRLLGGMIYLVETRNSGAAFSSARARRSCSPVVPSRSSTIILRTARRMYSIGWAVALGLVLGGALGNIIDRLFRAPGVGRGHVVDWISLFSADGAHFPIFNLADSAIICGAMLAALVALLGIDFDGSARPSAVRADVAMTSPRLLPVPDGLDGLRVDVALARLFGMSRTAAAEPGRRGQRRRRRGDGQPLGEGARRVVARGDPARARAAPPAQPRSVDGLVVLYDDEDVVVVDKPVGVAAHPSPGWTGPTVVQGLAAMGYRIATSGAAERQGVVHRLDAGTTGVMVVAKSERAYSVLKRRVPRAYRRQALLARSCRAIPIRPAAPSTRRSTGTRRPTTGSPSLPAGGRASRTTRPSRRFARRRCSTSASRPGAPTRSGCTWPRSAIRASAI